MKRDNIRRILDTLCWNMEWHDKEDDIRDAILAIEVLMLDERIDELGIILRSPDAHDWAGQMASAVGTVAKRYNKLSKLRGRSAE